MAALAGALLTVGAALLSHGGAPWWVSAQPHIQAIGPFINICDGPHVRYLKQPGYVPPPWCQGTSWYHGPNEDPAPGDAPPPPIDAVAGNLVSGVGPTGPGEGTVLS